MNGQEQKERHTAVANLERKFAKLEDAVGEAYKIEVESRTKAMEELKALFAKMVDDETQFRKADVRTRAEQERALTEAAIALVSTSLIGFLKLSWWQRWLWVLIGSKALLWFPVSGLTQRRRQEPPTKTATDQPYYSEKP